MIIGCCAKPEMAKTVKQAGFDTIELPVTAVAEMSEDAFQSLRETLKQLDLPSPSFNVLFPGQLQLMTASDREISDYLNHALARVHALSGKTVVFGSGRSRFRPDGMSYSVAFRRLVHVTGIIGDAAKPYGITIVIEPLNRMETNTINSLAEGAALVSSVNHPNVALLADYYHVTLDHEPISDIVRLSGVSHVHIATTLGRLVPTVPDEGYSELFRALKATDYKGILAVEGKNDDLLRDGPASIRMLKSLWANC